MVTPSPSGDREKVVSKLPSWLRQDLKVRAAELGVDIQDATSQGITAWRAADADYSPIDTAGAASFSTWLPPGQWDEFKDSCNERGIPFVQGLAQSIQLWLNTHPSPRHRPVTGVSQRKIVINQKGGVGKTAVAAGLAQALAEDGMSVLLVDYDPQGHLSDQLGVGQISPGTDSLVLHMCGEGKGNLRDLVVTIEEPRFGKRLHVLPACPDGFLLDARIALSRMRNKEAALERALQPLEKDFDAIVVDCPPSLGMATDAAIYYGRRRQGEGTGISGMVIPVLAEDSSATAYTMLADQIESLRDDLKLDVEYLGLVVNLYDSRRGFVATSSLQEWRELGDPRVLAVIGDLKEQREAVRMHRPLLAYAPHSDQSEIMRQIAREIS
ncbi:phosphopantetheine--protein transferase [Streptomyces sp. CB02009]|uniref:ParA family protein n=1 Tax=Streptomyces sp. CB02009 TaxID=1703938 RepID=UPI000939188D|nr:ParA family protein [Streptomyces sp. CB02009]OKJ49490.1 phosphopantetheine--protein transferase [Streptomyces sp. CB02009]